MNNSNKRKTTVSVLILILAAMIWGFAFSAQKGAGELGGFTVGAVRNLFATLFLIPMIPLTDKLTGSGRRLIKIYRADNTPPNVNEKGDVAQTAGSDYSPEKANDGEKSKHSELQKARPAGRCKARPDVTKAELIGGIVAGFFMTFATALQQNGIGDGTDAGKAGFITALYVVIVPIYALLFGKKSPLKVWLSALVAVVGFYLLSVKSDFSVVPSDLLILLCAFVFAAQIMAVDLFSDRCECVRLSLVQFASGFVINLIFALIFESPIAFDLIGKSIFPLLYLGILSSGVAYTLQVVGQKNLNPAVASILLSLESVFGAIGGALVYGEKMSERELFGAVTVFFAVILSQIDFKKFKINGEKPPKCK